MSRAGLGRGRRAPRRARTAAVALGAAAALAGCGGAGATPAGPVPTGLATVQRGDLVETEDVAGTLGFAGARPVGAAAAGTVTRLRPEGTVVPRGRSLYSVDRVAAGFVLRGAVPMYRTLQHGVGDGPDVRQLERELRALGHDPGTVDDTFTGATAAAVRAWEDARGSTADGVVEPGEVVVVDGRARVGRHRAGVGDRVAAGAPVAELSTTRREVTAKLPASRQDAVRPGRRVVVTLPDGSEVRGRITEVGRVATAGQEGEEATVRLRVAVGGRAPLDGAPVTVAVPVATLRDALTVPVTALVAVGADTYAVQLRDGAEVPVEVGAVVDGRAEVSGVREGAQVVVPS